MCMSSVLFNSIIYTFKNGSTCLAVDKDFPVNIFLGISMLWFLMHDRKETFSNFHLVVLLSSVILRFHLPYFI